MTLHVFRPPNCSDAFERGAEDARAIWHGQPAISRPAAVDRAAGMLSYAVLSLIALIGHEHTRRILSDLEAASRKLETNEATG